MYTSWTLIVVAVVNRLRGIAKWVYRQFDEAHPSQTVATELFAMDPLLAHNP
jgi:hypothetical protein